QQDRQAGQRGGCRQLRVEQAAAADEADQEDRRGGRDGGSEVDRVEELVPAEDEADQGGGRNPGRDQGHHDSKYLVPKLGAVDARRLKEIGRNLEEKRAQQPHPEREVDRGVDEDQRQDVVEQVQVPGQQVQRHEAGGKRQEAGRDEEEEHVLSLLHRPDGKGVRGGQSEHEEQKSRNQACDRRVDEEGWEVAG